VKKIGIILIIISAVLLLAGNSIGELWPISKEIFESSFTAIIGLIGIIFLAEGIKSEKQTR
jgi:hypothetical protein